MTIKKYTGKTKEEAISQAKAELGEGIVIMNAKDKKPEGVLGVFRKGVWEVTVAIEDDEPAPRRNIPTMPSTSTFSVAADEAIDIPSTGRIGDTLSPPPNKKPQPQLGPVASSLNPSSISEEDLKSAFRAVSQVIENTPNMEVSSAKTSVDSAIIKKEDIRETKRSEPVSAPKKEAPAPAPAPKPAAPKKKNENNLPLVRMVYNNLIENEVDEKYINEILDDMGNILSAANSLDYLISNIYQKMVLKLGKPVTISAEGKGPNVVFFIGPTGVGKTTTIAKIAAEFKLEQNKKVALITADTYRIGAEEQLNIYAGIMEAPISAILEPENLMEAVESFKDYDLIFVDTVGFSHKNSTQREATRLLLDSLNPSYRKEVYLVLSATTKYEDLKDIADTYSSFTNYNLVFTKLDETNNFGNILNMRLYTNSALSYVTDGQTVPDDIEVIDSQKLVKGLLGG